MRGEERHAALAGSHLALCASGTATLETGLLGTPMIVLYRLKALTYWMARWLVDLPHFCIVNLVLGERVVPELLQARRRRPTWRRWPPSCWATRPAIAAMREGLGRLRPALGAAGASPRAAAAVIDRWRRWELL